MTSLRLTIPVIAAFVLSCSLQSIHALPTPNQSDTTQAAPDNSKQNNTQTNTADNQSSAQSDRLITARIRKAIVADKSLSTYAHNVKIITSNGTVTLKGPVNSEDEKQKVASAAAAVVAPDQVNNQITIKQ
jgi:hyperosmotically inducible protein